MSRTHSDSQKTKINKSMLYRTLLVFVPFLILSTLFGYLANEVVEGETMATDHYLLGAIQAISNPVTDVILKQATVFGGVLMVLLFLLVLEIFLLQTKKWRWALFAALSVGGVLVINSVLKLLFERDRPYIYNLVLESTYSFPSGHAALSMALALTIIAIAWKTSWRKIAIVVGMVYVLLIGFSRLYLTVHYPTDVLAGWILASLWVLLVFSMMHWSIDRYIKPRQHSAERNE